MKRTKPTHHRPSSAVVAEELSEAGANTEWRKRQIILPEELVTKLFEWHGGQFTAIYALASSGMRGLVSLSMIDAASVEISVDIKDLDSRKRRRFPKSTQEKKLEIRELKELLGELETIRQFWKEHSAKESGMEAEEDFDYDFDSKDYGLENEDEIDTHSG